MTFWTSNTIIWLFRSVNPFMSTLETVYFFHNIIRSHVNNHMSIPISFIMASFINDNLNIVIK